MAKAQLTEAELTTIRMAAHAVWNYIAADVMTAVIDEHPNDPEKQTITRDEVLELTCDAGRLEAQIRRTNKTLATRVANLQYRTVLDILRPAFPYERYE